MALTRIAQGTAKEISRISDVPRSRVYDTVDRLHRRGLVDIQQSEPREYRAVAKEVAFEKLREAYNSNIETADEALEQVASAETQEDKGVWAIANADHVSDRVIDLLDDAEEHVHFIIADETTLKRGCLEQLAVASDRGVTIVVEVPSESVQSRVQEAVPGAHVVVSKNLQGAEKVVQRWPGQLILVDRQKVLASGVGETDLPGVEEESAMWSHGNDHGFAAWIPELLDDRVTD